MFACAIGVLPSVCKIPRHGHGKVKCKCQLDQHAYRPHSGWLRVTLRIPYLQHYRSALRPHPPTHPHPPRRAEVKKHLMNVGKKKRNSFETLTILPLLWQRNSARFPFEMKPCEADWRQTWRKQITSLLKDGVVSGNMKRPAMYV